MFICSCHGITKQEIENCLAELGPQACTADLQKACHAGTECGGCLELLEKLIQATGAGLDQSKASQS